MPQPEIGIGIGPTGPSFSLGFGGGQSSASRDRALRTQYKYAARYAGSHLQTLRRRAEEAGYHPLAALGISPGTPASQPIGSQSGIRGQISSKTLSAPEAAAIRESNARTELLKAQRDEVLAQMEASKAARIKQGIQDHNIKPLAQAENRGMVIESNIAKFANTPDAQQIQDRYGEIPEQLSGLVNMGADAVANIPESVFDNYINTMLIQHAKFKARRARLKGKRPYTYQKPSKSRSRRQ